MTVQTESRTKHCLLFMPRCRLSSHRFSVQSYAVPLKQARKCRRFCGNRVQSCANYALPLAYFRPRIVRIYTDILTKTINTPNVSISDYCTIRCESGILLTNEFADNPCFTTKTTHPCLLFQKTISMKRCDPSNSHLSFL